MLNLGYVVRTSAHSSLLDSWPWEGGGVDWQQMHLIFAVFLQHPYILLVQNVYQSARKALNNLLC